MSSIHGRGPLNEVRAGAAGLAAAGAGQDLPGGRVHHVRALARHRSDCGAKAAFFSHMDLSVTDGSGVEYVSDGGGAQGLPSADSQLAPGASGGGVVYMVPADAQGLHVEVREGLVGAPAGVVALGF